MKQIYHIRPVFTEAIWGGQQLIQKYGFKTELSNIGECYNVIAMKGHLDCDVEETGEKLSDFYHTHRDLFQCDTKEMPVRAAMACTKAPMSVQVHPNDEYALAHDGRLGKPDGVYILEGEGTVEFGHYAKTRAEFRHMVEENMWNSLLRYINVKAGDFLNMPFGTLHALGSNMIFFEFSQNADLTYRLYDYHRKQLDPKTGKPRTYQIDKVIDCVNIPDAETSVEKLRTFEKDGCMITFFHNEPGVYTCGKIEVESQGTYQRDQFIFLTCVDGEGKVNDVTIRGGETLFVPVNFGELKLYGKMVLTFLTYLKP